ncbi:acyl carrier protein [Streptomyces sp. TLI_171]|uniref:acyl carrier protein n=1 Tax=Streptomyces sp. TLI_171 TaxID=1938859 RepID=UPI0015D54726|nr:acyl carrier protein [Streptomyces sp. TLI_171]
MSEIAESVARIWTDSVGAPPPTPDTDFFDAGGTSLALVHFLAGIHDAFGVELPLDRLFTDGFTVTGAAATVERLLLEHADEAELDALTAELDQLSDEEIRALLAEGS